MREDSAIAVFWTLGMALGIRTVMLLTNSTTIRDVLLFPTMKPIDNTHNKIENEE